MYLLITHLLVVHGSETLPVPSDWWPAAPPQPRVAPTEGAPQPHIIIHVTDDQGR